MEARIYTFWLQVFQFLIQVLKRWQTCCEQYCTCDETLPVCFDRLVLMISCHGNSSLFIMFFATKYFVSFIFLFISITRDGVEGQKNNIEIIYLISILLWLFGSGQSQNQCCQRCFKCLLVVIIICTFVIVDDVANYYFYLGANDGVTLNTSSNPLLWDTGTSLCHEHQKYVLKYTARSCISFYHHVGFCQPVGVVILIWWSGSVSWVTARPGIPTAWDVAHYITHWFVCTAMKSLEYCWKHLNSKQNNVCH